MHILTAADLLLSQDNVADRDQRVLLNELRRFLSHESAGVRGFDRMPRSWSELNRLVSNGGTISAKSEDAVEVLAAWHQETRDLSLILSRLTETQVSERLPRKHLLDASARLKDEHQVLRETNCLTCLIDIPDAAAPVLVRADMMRRTLEAGMSLRAPEDRQSTRARLNWLLKQIKAERVDEYFVRLHWPGRNEPTQFSIPELRSSIDVATEGKEHLSVHTFEVFISRRIGARFTQQTNFIEELEKIVPDFYRTVGSDLLPWKKKAPRIRDESVASDVSTEAISEEAEAFGEGT